MANIKSAEKRMRQSARRHLRNRMILTRVRSAVKAARTAVASGTPEAAATVQQALRLIDKAVTKGVLHRNTAARRKSALAKSLARH